MGEAIGMVVLVAIAVLIMLALGTGAALVARDTFRQRGRWGINLKPIRCPGCGEPAPTVRKPKNRQQALWGGVTCDACGLEYDKWGRPVGKPGSTSAASRTAAGHGRSGGQGTAPGQSAASSTAAVALSVQCPRCASRLKVREEHAGKRVRCPKCATPVPVPGDIRGARPAGRHPVEFEVRHLISKRPNGYGYRVTATDDGITFTCLTVNEGGRRPTQDESAKYDFRLGWKEIAEVRKPATMVDRLLVFVTQSGEKIQCTFTEDGDEDNAFHMLRDAFATMPAVQFTRDQTPMWKGLIVPVGFSILMLVFGYLSYVGLDDLERTGGRIRTHAVVALIYKTLGKYGVMAFFAFLSFFGAEGAG
jgi:hypothetical protein